MKQSNSQDERVPRMSRGSRRLMGCDIKKKTYSKSHDKVALHKEPLTKVNVEKKKLSATSDDDDEEYIMVYDSNKDKPVNKSKQTREDSGESGIECEKISSASTSSKTSSSNASEASLIKLSNSAGSTASKTKRLVEFIVATMRFYLMIFIGFVVSTKRVCRHQDNPKLV